MQNTSSRFKKHHIFTRVCNVIPAFNSYIIQYRVLSTSKQNSFLGDSLAWQNGRPFFTYDKDTTPVDNWACAFDCHGAWWYRKTAAVCSDANLNGKWGGPNRSRVDTDVVGTRCTEMINWHHFKGDLESVKTTEMKIRRKV